MSRRERIERRGLPGGRIGDPRRPMARVCGSHGDGSQRRAHARNNGGRHIEVVLSDHGGVDHARQRLESTAVA